MSDLKTPKRAKWVKADFDYKAQGDEELSFQQGDMIKVLHEEDETWWCGECKHRKGMFPKTFVSVVNK